MLTIINVLYYMPSSKRAPYDSRGDNHAYMWTSEYEIGCCLWHTILSSTISSGACILTCHTLCTIPDLMRKQIKNIVSSLLLDVYVLFDCWNLSRTPLISRSKAPIFSRELRFLLLRQSTLLFTFTCIWKKVIWYPLSYLLVYLFKINIELPGPLELILQSGFKKSTLAIQSWISACHLMFFFKKV